VRSDDLVPLLAARNNGAGVGFRQGTVVAWDQDTAENVILVGDSLIENLPVLNTSEASLLIPGDVVMLLTAGASWAVMGRVIIPGSPEAASSIRSITNRIQAAELPGAGYRTSTSYGDLTDAAVGPTVSIRIGSSGRALCFWSAELGQALNGSGVVQYQTRNTPHASVEVGGASTIAPSDFNALNINVEHPGPGFAGEALTSFWMQSSVFHLFSGLTPGLTTFTMKYRTDTMVPANRSYFQAREIAVFAL
jgi:hypothetical protein